MRTVTFLVLEGVDKGRVYKDLPIPVTIGREEGNGLRLNDERVSRFHAKVQIEDGDIILTDLDSTNGTRVNGSAIQIRRLRAGDQVSIGRTMLLFGTMEEIAARRATAVPASEAAQHIFGYTCVNDVTAVEYLNDPEFAHWTRAKGFDTFAPFGPVIATGLDVASLTVQTWLDDTLRQDYAVADMVFGPAELVADISRDMTLMPGDVIACGTSRGAGRLKAGRTVTVRIAGIGDLVNTYAE